MVILYLSLHMKSDICLEWCATNLHHCSFSLISPIRLAQRTMNIFWSLSTRAFHVVHKSPAFFYDTADTRGCTWSWVCSRDRPSARSAYRPYCSRPGSWRNGTLWSWNAWSTSRRCQRTGLHPKRIWTMERISMVGVHARNRDQICTFSRG